MYKQSELQLLQKQLRKRKTVLILFCALCGMMMIVGAVARIFYLAVLMTVLIGASLVATLDLLIQPLNKYCLHVQQALSGRVHKAPVVILSLDDQHICQVNGIACYALTAMDEEGHERIFYLDERKKECDIQKNSRVMITYYDRMIADLQPVSD